MSDFWNGNYYKQHAVLQEAATLDMLKVFPFKGNERILDIGCGPGNISKWIADQLPQGEVIGIDPSMQMLRHAMSDYKAVSNLEFLCEKVETFKFDEEFDVVMSFQALHFAKDHLQTFKQIQSALVPGGRVFIRVISRVHPTMREVFDREPWRSTVRFEDRVFPITADRAEAILDQLGFTHIEVELDKRAYSFSSAEKIVEWLMTWLRYPSGLSEERTCDLASEIAQHFCHKEGRDCDIQIQMQPIMISAYSPA